MITSIGQLKEAYLQHLVLKGRSERTLEGYGAYLNEFLEFAATKGVPASAPATKLERELLTAFQVRLATRNGPNGKKLSLATRNLFGSAVRGMLRHGVTVLDLELPAPDTVVLAKVGDRGTRRMDTDEFDRLVAAIPKDSEHSLRDRALLEVLFATGCRLSELCGLTRRRVNLKTREVEVMGKGKKVRGTFLTETAADWLQRYLNTRRDDSPYLFISRQTVRHVADAKTGVIRPVKDIYPLHPNTVEHIVKQLALRAGLPDEFSPHWLRHGRLTIVARHAGLLAAQELAGHASPETTRRYTKITGSELKKHFDDADRRERRPD
ncbi:MAG: tyrosine-type recombinase/integrase [Chloroflexota bacterium]|nr:tyrosine-type recombinase/integrase [Chloroflexota bacterium]